MKIKGQVVNLILRFGIKLKIGHPLSYTLL